MGGLLLPGIDILSDPDGCLRVIEVNVTPAITYPHDETVPYVVDYIDGQLAQHYRGTAAMQIDVA